MNKEIYLNSKIFLNPEEIEKVSICQGFNEGLLMSGDNDKRVVTFCPSNIELKKSQFAREYPERFFKDNTEQSLFSVAFGMAVMGKIPFVLLSALFPSDKSWEQIKRTMFYNNMPIKIIGSYDGIFSGLSSRRMFDEREGVASMRSIPSMTILSPCDAIEAQKATIYAAQIDGPVYISFPREETPIITTEETPFGIGKAEIFFRPEGGADVGIITTGPLAYNAILAAKELDYEGIRVRVLNLSTIKPLDIDAIVELAQQTGKIITLEEHQTRGGLGSIIAETLAQILPVKMRFIGAHNIFGRLEEQEESVVNYCMNIENIKKVVRQINEN